MGTRIFPLLRHQKQNLKLFVNHASTSIPSTRLLSSQRSRIYSVNNNQPRRNKHCRRVDVCAKKKKKELEEQKKAKERESSLWGMLFGVRRKKPQLNTCRRLQAIRQWEEEEIPEFITEMCKDLPEGSAIYKTRGHAFLVEVPCPRTEAKKKTRDEILLAKIERDKRSINLEDENNPMPCNQTNPGIRWIDLNNRRLHPLYKKMEMPTTIHPKAYALEWKKQCKGDETDDKCKPKTNLICATWDHLRRKENFSDVKMGVLPRYIQLREQEYMVNRNSSLETKKDKFKPCNFRKCPMTECPEIDCDRWKKPQKILKKNI